MASADRQRWDEKYAGREFSGTLEPDQWLVETIADLPPGRAWEPACGVGHNAVFLAQQGWWVDAVDVSPVGLNHARRLAEHYSVQVNWLAADLDEFAVAGEEYDLVCVFRFLDRRRLPGLIGRALKPGGILLYETFTVAQLDRPDNHLKNRAFLLEPGELPRLFPKLDVIEYEELDLPERSLARLRARKRR